MQVPPPVVQPVVMHHTNQGYHSGMLLVYLGTPSSTVVTPQYAYTGAPYIPFGVHYGQTSNQIVNPGLVQSTQMFLRLVTPHIDSQLRVPLVPMPCYSFPHGVTSQY